MRQAAAAGVVAAGTDSALKQEIAARLAAHRARRSGEAERLGPTPVPTQTKGRASNIAAAVAERYAQSPSYRTYLAQQAEEAIRHAEAAAQVAVITAKAVAAAQCSLLAELDQSASPPSQRAIDPFSAEENGLGTALLAEADAGIEGAFDHAAQPQTRDGRLTVRMFEDVPLHQPSRGNAPTNEAVHKELLREEEVLALEEEIAFRHTPVFGQMAQMEIPANLLEFPRQLVAARKSRARLAEGPLRAENTQEDAARLRIFEVQPEQLSGSPADQESAPVWTSILLGAQPAPAPFSAHETAPQLASVDAVQPARFELRWMATMVDACIVLAAAAVFAGAFATTVGKVPEAFRTLEGGGVAAAVLLVTLAAMYQVLCLTLSNATAGMRYARIGLCTFADENPSRAQRLGRLAALAVSLAPLGIGVLWMLLDSDCLGGHDRLSKTYPRSY